MLKRVSTILLLCAAALLAAALPSTAAAAAPHPSISKIAPKKLGIGETLTISGRNFIPGKLKNTVVFKRDGKRALFARAEEATKRRLTIIVPEKLKPFLKGGGSLPATFRIRVLAKRFGKAFTKKGLSPVIGPRKTGTGKSPVLPAPAPPAPGDCDRDGRTDPVDGDDDNDQLPDDFETRSIKTEPCNPDTDGDGMEDGWEYKAAFDLNASSCLNLEYPQPCVPATPFSGKRPYPNPLDGGDRNVDFDGDGLPMGIEFLAWRSKPGHTIGSLNRSDGAMWYSDGLQASQDASSTDGCRGMAVPAPLGVESYRNDANYSFYSLDSLARSGARYGEDGCLHDGERDEDGDFLSNHDEVVGEMTGPGYTATLTGEPAFPVPFVGTEFLDSDTDGDGVVDGKDDQDNDDFWNIDELEEFRGPATVDAQGEHAERFGLWTHVYNPCLPAIYSRTCPTSIPLEGDVWRPFARGDAAPSPRWPLYRDALYSSTDPDGAGPLQGSPERWGSLRDGDPTPQQTLPPPHPLPR